MGLPISSHVNLVEAATTAIAGAKVLRRVLINTGVAAGTVTITQGGAALAIIDAAAVRQIEYHCAVNGLSVTLSDAALDVTVVYD